MFKKNFLATKNHELGLKAMNLETKSFEPFYFLSAWKK